VAAFAAAVLAAAVRAVVLAAAAFVAADFAAVVRAAAVFAAVVVLAVVVLADVVLAAVVFAAVVLAAVVLAAVVLAAVVLAAVARAAAAVLAAVVFAAVLFAAVLAFRGAVVVRGATGAELDAAPVTADAGATALSTGSMTTSAVAAAFSAADFVAGRTEEPVAVGVFFTGAFLAGAFFAGAFTSAAGAFDPCFAEVVRFAGVAFGTVVESSTFSGRSSGEAVTVLRYQRCLTSRGPDATFVRSIPEHGRRIPTLGVRCGVGHKTATGALGPRRSQGLSLA
jgi:hypothetical protein